MMKRVLLFAAISVLSVAAVLVFTYNAQTIHAIRSFNWRYAGVLIALWAAATTGSALSFWALARATESRLAAGEAYSAAFLRVFGNLVTPFSFGGGPFAVFSMSERGVSSGKGSSIVITQMMVVSFYVLAVALASFLHLRHELIARPLLLAVFLVAGIAQIGGVVVTLLILIYPHGAIKLISGVGLLLAKLLKDSVLSVDEAGRTRVRPADRKMAQQAAALSGSGRLQPRDDGRLVRVPQ